MVAERQRKRPAWKGSCCTGFCHPGLNVHYVFAATDGQPDREMFVYRYKRSAANRTDEDKE